MPFQSKAFVTIYRTLFQFLSSGGTLQSPGFGTAVDKPQILKFVEIFLRYRKWSPITYFIRRVIVNLLIDSAVLFYHQIIDIFYLRYHYNMHWIMEVLGSRLGTSTGFPPYL